MSTPTQRTLKLLRGEGYIADVAERWIQGAKIRRDLFNFIDIVAVKESIVGVQTGAYGAHAEKRKKILGLESALAWLHAGGDILIVTWRKKGRFWHPRQEWITKGEFDGRSDSLGLEVEP